LPPDDPNFPSRRPFGYNPSPMTPAQTLLALVPVAYFVGAIPFGFLVGKAKGIDVRTAGSGNIGATNVGRLLGGRFFALVFALDLLKGLLPMLAAGAAVGFAAADAGAYGLWLLVGFSAVAGHMFSPFLGFRGGKGVATSAGVVLGLFPYLTLPGLVALGVWGALFARTKIVSLASIAAAVVLPVAYLAFAVALGWQPLGPQWPVLAFTLLMAGLIAFRHRSNIARLRAGTEHRFGRVKPATAAGNGDRLPGANGDRGGNGDAGGHGRV
ncbi:MAG: plsY, partial [Phycisphaerales bacterium]|nr:plsY [Phycisphaerales bacterium]